MKDTQKTVASSVFLSGVGLHTGAKVKLSIHPSDANTGIKFCRVDLPDKPIIPADVRLVSEVKRSTTLNLNGATVTTIEHLLAALTAKGTSTIQNIEQIDRGYQYIDERLRKLGADIKRVEG